MSGKSFSILPVFVIIWLCATQAQTNIYAQARNLAKSHCSRATNCELCVRKSSCYWCEIDQTCRPSPRDNSTQKDCTKRKLKTCSVPGNSAIVVIVSLVAVLLIFIGESVTVTGACG